jgi:hypothetical protein
MRTPEAPPVPMFRTSIVYVSSPPLVIGSGESVLVTVRSGGDGVLVMVGVLVGVPVFVAVGV